LIVSVNDDVKRIYRSTTTPTDGLQPGDLVLTTSPTPSGPGAFPGLMGWWDASQTAAIDLSSEIPDVSGLGHHLNFVAGTGATLGDIFGQPAFSLPEASDYSEYYPNLPTNTPYTFAGVVNVAAKEGTFRYIIAEGSVLSTRTFVRIEGDDLQAQVGSVLVTVPLNWVSGRARFSFVLVANGPASSLWLDGVKVATLNAATWYRHGGVYVSEQGTTGLDGLLGEASYIEQALTNAECLELSDYMRRKWRV
jgi:hypothetical protein